MDRQGRARAEARDGPGTELKKLSGATDCQGHEADKSENIEIRNKEIYEFWHDINTCIERERDRERGERQRQRDIRVLGNLSQYAQVSKTADDSFRRFQTEYTYYI